MLRDAAAVVKQAAMALRAHYPEEHDMVRACVTSFHHVYVVRSGSRRLARGGWLRAYGCANHRHTPPKDLCHQSAPPLPRRSWCCAGTGWA